MNRYTMLALFAMLLTTVPALAAPDTAVSAHLPAAVRSSLLGSIQAYRVSHPSAFAAVAGVRGCAQQGYRNNRNPVPECARELRGLGKDVLLPMLDALISGTPAGMAQTPAEHRALTFALCQAVGVLRAPEAQPVLRAVLQTARDLDVQQAAAEGLGRFCGSAEWQLLTAHTGSGDALETAALAGVGVCKRPAAAEHLASLLAAHPAPERAALVAHALGIAASSWSWQALGASRAADALAARTAAARTLAPAFFAYSGPAHKAAAEGLQMAEHPDTATLLQDAARQAGASVALRDEAQRLAARIAAHKR